MFQRPKELTEAQKRQLGTELWSWSLCAQCSANKQCNDAKCPSQRLPRLGRYMRYVEELRSRHAWAAGRTSPLATDGPEYLLRNVNALRSNPNQTKAQLLSHLEATTSHKYDVSQLESELDLTVRIFTMVDCSSSHDNAFVEHGLNRVPWKANVTFSEYITSAFPECSAVLVGSEKNELHLQEIRQKLRASKLSKRAGLRFQATNDITSHLKLNRKAKTVEIFHHASFLKEQLRLTKDAPVQLEIDESLKHGALPRQIVLEVQDSLQYILFPLSHGKSKKLLLSLIKHASFDPECKNWDFTSIRRSEETVVPYHYFGSRLVDLYEELENPKPNGWLQELIERKSGARYVMLATLYALFIGTMGLGVAILQTYFTYQAWKHPTQGS